MCKVKSTEEIFCKEHNIEVGKMIRLNNRFWTIEEELKEYELWLVVETGREHTQTLITINDMMVISDFKVYGKV